MKHYPSQMDLQGLDKLERVVRDIYNRIYDIPKQQAQTNSKLQSDIKKVERLAGGGGGTGGSGGGGGGGPVVPPTTIPLPYGSMYNDMNSWTVNVVVANNSYPILGNMNLGLTSGGAFTFQNNCELLCNVVGIYLVNWSMSLQAASPNQDLEGFVMIGDVEQANTTNHSVNGSANKNTTVAGTGILSLVVNDRLRLGVSNHTNTGNIIVQHANLTAVKIV